MVVKTDFAAATTLNLNRWSLSEGCWLILFSNHNAATLGAAAAALRAARNWTVQVQSGRGRPQEGNTIVVTEGTRSVSVGLNEGPLVSQESAEIAVQHARGRPDQSSIAKASRRFEIRFDLDQDMGNLNTALFVQHALVRLLGGDCATFMANVGTFI
jgi:hypothetical protein